MESIKTITVLSVCADKTISDKQYDQLSKTASRYVGTIYRLADDSVIIIFGLPTAYQNDHERAIEAAGELRLNFSSFRMGISTGDIPISYDVILDYKQMALTTEASDLARAAEPGQVLINPKLYSLVEKVFRCRPRQQSTGAQYYEIIGISEQLKQQLKSKASWRKGHSQSPKKSTNERQRRQKLKSSRAKFSRKFKKLKSKTLLYVYYLFMTIAIIASVLAILIWGC
ncbi:MAG: hypothetical protein ACE5PV_01590 [Candidatus Poribacteria bacterium]